MYVCICRQITESKIREVCRKGDGATSLSDLRKQLGVGVECGKCSSHARAVLREYHQSTSFDPSLATAIAV